MKQHKSLSLLIVDGFNEPFTDKDGSLQKICVGFIGNKFFYFLGLMQTVLNQYRTKLICSPNRRVSLLWYKHLSLPPIKQRY